MRASLLLLALVVGGASAGLFLNVIEEASFQFGSCFSDMDCVILTGLPNTTVSCDPFTSYCVDATNTQVPPLPGGLCGDTTVDPLRIWGPIVTSAQGGPDGRMHVRMTPSIVGRNLRGFLRVMDVPLGAPVPTRSDPYFREQAVSPECEVYVFSNMPFTPGGRATRVAFFDVLGCVAYSDVIVPNWVSKVPPIVATNADFGLVFFDLLDNIVARPTADGRTREFGVPDAIWGGFNEDALVGERRLLVGQVFDQGGAPLLTKIGTENYVGPPGAPLDGVIWPAFADGNDQFDDSLTAATLSGRVMYRAVVGYTFRQMPNAPLEVLKDALGRAIGFELAMSPPDSPFVSYTDVSTLSPPPAPYLPDAYFQNDGIFMSTILRTASTAGVFPGLNFERQPRLTLTPVIGNTPQATPSMPELCLNSTVTGTNVNLNYTAFGFGSGVVPAFVQLFMINTSRSAGGPIDEGGNEIPVSVEMPLLTEVNFFIDRPGFYCASLNVDLLDGFEFTPQIFGRRRVHQMCFQVGGPAGADGIPVMSRLNSLDDPADAGGGNVIAGVFTNVDTDIMVTMPAILVVNKEHKPRIILNRMSMDPLEQQYIEEFSATEFDVFRDGATDALDVDFWYNAESFSSPADVSYVVYYLRRSPYFGQDGTYFRLMRPAATLFQEEIADIVVRTHYNETSFLTQGRGSIDYECPIMFPLKNLVVPQLRVSVETVEPICPDQLGELTVRNDGNFLIPFEHPDISLIGVSEPEFHPVTTWVNVTNADPTSPGFGVTLESEINLNQFAVAPNVLYEITVYAQTRAFARTTAFLQSRIAESATRVFFDLQQPECRNGTQVVRLSYFLMGDTAGAFTNWYPADTLANTDLWDPNNVFFDLPDPKYCPLLLNLTVFEVNQICRPNGIPVNSTECDPCNQLPTVLENVEGDDLITNVDESFWTVVTWVPTEFFNNATGRFIYCRSANTTKANVPRPTSLIFQNLRRIFIDPPDGPEIPCQGNECYAVTIIPDVDDFYESRFASLVQIFPQPPFPVTPFAVTGGDPQVEVGETYLITTFLDDVLCPTQITYIPLARGPRITVPNVWRTNCGVNQASVLLNARYDDPDMPTGQVRDVCMFWDTGGALPTFYSFQLPINAIDSTALPTDQFGFDVGVERFEGVPPGLYGIMLYDRCESNTCGNVDCASLITNQDTFELVNPNLAFNIFTLNVTTLRPEGGIFVELTDFDDAQCWGDDYRLEFSVFDFIDEGFGSPPYEVRWFDPLGRTLDTSPICIGTGDDAIGGVPAEAYDNVPVSTSQIRLFRFNTTIETGPEQGISFKGNYTLSVRSCKTQCIANFPVFIEVVQPFTATVSAVPSTCFNQPGQLVIIVSGGKPFDSGQFIQMPDSSLIMEADYFQECITPFTPTDYVPGLLPTRMPPGFYSCRFRDGKNCTITVNATIESAPPIVAEVLGATPVCQGETTTIVSWNVTGGTGEISLYELIGNVTDGGVITVEYVSAANRTQEIYFVDEVNCRSDAFSFEIPPAAPLDLVVTVEPSCESSATGIAVATVAGSDTLMCEWSSSLGAVPILQTCTLQNIPGTAEVTVVATELNGCTAVETVTIPVRPQLRVVNRTRSDDGVLGEECIDVITGDIQGGLLPPPFLIELFMAPPNTTLIYNGTRAFRIEGVCRSLQYFLEIAEGDGACPIIATFVDLSFGVGDPGDVVCGLPFFEPPVFGFQPVEPQQTKSNAPFYFTAAIIAAVGVVACSAAFGACYYVYDRKRKRNR